MDEIQADEKVARRVYRKEMKQVVLRVVMREGKKVDPTALVKDCPLVEQ